MPINAVRIDRVDERHAFFRRHLPHELKRLVKVAADGQDLRSRHDGLGELPHGDVSMGDDDKAWNAGSRGVGSRRRGSVSRRCANHRFRPILQGLRDRQGHAAILEGPGRVGAVVLQVDFKLKGLPANLGQVLFQVSRPQEGRVPFLKAHDRRRFGDWQVSPVALKERDFCRAWLGFCFQFPLTRRFESSSGA